MQTVSLLSKLKEIHLIECINNEINELFTRCSPLPERRHMDLWVPFTRQAAATRSPPLPLHNFSSYSVSIFIACSFWPLNVARNHLSSRCGKSLNGSLSVKLVAHCMLWYFFFFGIYCVRIYSNSLKYFVLKMFNIARHFQRFKCKKLKYLKVYQHFQYANYIRIH